MIVWNELSDHKLFRIEQQGLPVFSIKRVMASNKFIFKTSKNVTLLTVNDLNSFKFTLLHLLDCVDDDFSGQTDSLQL